ncbi:MAG: Y-family DNA polymerase [Patescibacteria group bacterium]
MTFIGLLDCNNFFVSCERLFRPDLRDVPTMVLSSNDGCVVARSQEIKDMGIPMGIPFFKIKDIIKDKRTAVFSSNFPHYREVSRRVFAVMRQEIDTVEQYSVDEAFFTLSAVSIEEAQEKVVRIRNAIQTKVGMPVSIGLASTKTLAKLANSKAKKGDGIYLLDPTNMSEINDIPLGEVWGIGGGRAREMKGHGLVTIKDLINADTERVQKLFGIAGKRLQQELSGASVERLKNRLDLQKSIMSTRSFASSTDDLLVLEDAVAYHVRHALEDLREMGAKATHIRVMIRPSRHGDYMLRGGSAEAILDVPSDDTILYIKEAIKLTKQLYEPKVPYKKAGVIISGIVATAGTQQPLFVDQELEERQGLMEVIDAVNAKLGRETLRAGDRKLRSKWQTKKELVSPAYTTRWSDIATVAAK